MLKLHLQIWEKLQPVNLQKKHKPQGLKANRKIAKAGGEVAKTARDDLERKLGETVISRDNQLNFEYIEDVKKLKK